MAAIALFFQRYPVGTLLGDAMLRAGILGTYAYCAMWISRHWEATVNSAMLSIRGFVNPLIVYGLVCFGLFTIFGPALMRITGTSALGRRTGRAGRGAGVYVTKVFLMTLVNTFVLCVRVGFAAFMPGTLQTCIDAGTHFVERQADVIIGPQRG